MDGYPYLQAEAVRAVEDELAMSLDDVLARRLRLVQELRDRGAGWRRGWPRSPEGPGWDGERQAGEVARYLEQAHREYDVPMPA